MGHIPSAQTVYSVAYLTELGRTYLFNKDNSRYANGQDNFKITQFSLGDPDVNYKTTGILDSGEVPDVSGKKDSCIKGCRVMNLRNKLYFTPPVYVDTTAEYQIIVEGGDTIINVNDTSYSPNIITVV